VGNVLDHERLDVYQLALELCALALRVAAQLPRGHAHLADQLRRSATSIPLNIAEGTGKVSSGERAQCHRVARGEAMECGAALDVIRLLGCVAAEEIDRGKELATRIVAMLTRMIR
jgi:four helix bundle protein